MSFTTIYSLILLLFLSLSFVSQSASHTSLNSRHPSSHLALASLVETTSKTRYNRRDGIIIGARDAIAKARVDGMREAVSDIRRRRIPLPKSKPLLPLYKPEEAPRPTFHFYTPVENDDILTNVRLPNGRLVSISPLKQMDEAPFLMNLHAPPPFGSIPRSTTPFNAWYRPAEKSLFDIAATPGPSPRYSYPIHPH